MPLCASVYMFLVVTCWERADLLALVCGVSLCVCHFLIGILGQVWYLIVLIPDLCTLTYLEIFSGFWKKYKKFMHFEKLMPFIMHKIIFVSKVKKKICVPSLPKIFSPVNRNTLIFLFGLIQQTAITIFIVNLRNQKRQEM